MVPNPGIPQKPNARRKKQKSQNFIYFENFLRIIYVVWYLTPHYWCPEGKSFICFNSCLALLIKRFTWNDFYVGHLVGKCMSQ